MRIAWSRAVASVFWFATAGYCVLSAVPFASEQFLKPGLVPALVTLAQWHTWISLAALAACATTPAAAPEPGTPVSWYTAGTYEVEIAGERVGADASLRPFYDPSSQRPRG